MSVVQHVNAAIGRAFIKDFDNTDRPQARIYYGIFAGWVSIVAILSLFTAKMVLGIMAGSVSLLANAFHLLSELAASVVVLFSFWLASRPATAKTPFGHGRMEQVAPLVMSILLFVAGIQVGERSVHQAIHPSAVHYWSALPWILLATIGIREWLAQFVRFLGTRVHSEALLATASHHHIDSGITLAVIIGLILGHHFRHPEMDGYIGILASLWLLYLGYHHAKEAIIPILGKAPSKELIAAIRDEAKKVQGVRDVHEIIVHDYGSMYIMTLHAEIEESGVPESMHEIAETCEARLRNKFRGEVVCHTDPLMAHTPESQAIEDTFRTIVEEMDVITAYHDFRIVSYSPQKIIIVADLDLNPEIPDSTYTTIAADLDAKVKKAIPNVAYCSFYVTPKFAY